MKLVGERRALASAVFAFYFMVYALLLLLGFVAPLGLHLDAGRVHADHLGVQLDLDAEQVQLAALLKRWLLENE